MKIKLIVAASENNVIGKENDLPWHLPDDMLFFKQKTLDSVVIMGRNNYLSIPQKYRPLPNRFNIILTNKSSFLAKDCLVLNSLEKAIETGTKMKKDVFVIGGGQLYHYALQNNLIDIIYLTRVHSIINGDTYFPELGNEWEEINRLDCKADKKHSHDYSFLTYKKNNRFTIK